MLKGWFWACVLITVGLALGQWMLHGGGAVFIVLVATCLLTAPLLLVRAVMPWWIPPPFGALVGAVAGGGYGLMFSDVFVNTITGARIAPEGAVETAGFLLLLPLGFVFLGGLAGMTWIVVEAQARGEVWDE
jgi:hypothetical protein